MLLVDYEVPAPGAQTIDGRRSMRSIADAIESLREQGRFSDHSLAQIKTGPILLPTGNQTCVMVVIGEPRPGESSCGVALPSSSFVTARRSGGASEKIETSRLDRAWVDNNGRVELSDGTCLHAVNVIPTVLHRELTDLQKRIVYWTIKFTSADAFRYPSWLPVTEDLEDLDYGSVYGVEVPSLEKIQAYLAERDWALQSLSRQTIANALSACGMRRPHPRKQGAA